MDWIYEVRRKLKNQILFSKDCEFLQDINEMIAAYDRRIVTLWALEMARETAQLLNEKYPGEDSPKRAAEYASLWVQGIIKMPAARREILRCHAFAKTITDMEDIALFHAVGQACSTVHTVRHAIGYPIYDLTAVVRRYGIDNCVEPVEKRKSEYIKKLQYIHDNFSDCNQSWAKFMV